MSHIPIQMRITGRYVLLAIAFCVLAAVLGPAQSPWTWTDERGRVGTRAELEHILEKHKLWLDSSKKSGAQATFVDANLTQAQLQDAELSGADLHGAILALAGLDGANLSNAHMDATTLDQATLLRTKLTHADLSYAQLTGANLWAADLSDTNLEHADLRNTDLTLANLSGAVLFNTDLTDADLRGVNLNNAIFEPKTVPSAEFVGGFRGLDRVRYWNNPTALVLLKKELQDTGYREDERAVICALNRHSASPSELRTYLAERWKSLRGKQHMDEGQLYSVGNSTFRSFVEGTFKWIAFDLTSEYGFAYGRPLRILSWLWLGFSIAYVLFMHRRGTSGIYMVATRWSRGRTNIQGIQIRVRSIPAVPWWKRPVAFIRREWRVLRVAMFFSLMSAFNIGFRDINFGRWLRLLTKNEYDLKAIGWARTVSGVQSLLSLYLIALWILVYFGRPFG